jgi:hypothetical protein
LGKGLTTSCKNTSLLQNVTQGLSIGRILHNNRGNGKWLRFETWNVRSLYRAGSLKTVASELAKYKYNLDLVAVHEVRWVEGGS